MKFTGSNVLVTGASRGIGAEIAKTLASYGLKVWINYRSGADVASKLQEEIEASGGKAAIIKADVTNEDEFVNAINTIIVRSKVLCDRTLHGLHEFLGCVRGATGTGPEHRDSSLRVHLHAIDIARAKI